MILTPAHYRELGFLACAPAPIGGIKDQPAHIVEELETLRLIECFEEPYGLEMRPMWRITEDGRRALAGVVFHEQEAA